ALRDEVLSKVGDGTGFVDVRSPEEFRGEKLAPDHLPQEQSQVPGHIPGSANIPWAKAANDDGTFKSADELRELYEGAGISGQGVVSVLFGLWLVVVTVASSIRTTILPRGVPARIGRRVFRAMRWLFALRIGRNASYERRDRIMAYYGPTALLALLVTWLVAI